MKNIEKEYANRIKNEYTPKLTTKVEQLKKLDQKVKRPAHIFAYLYGTLSALIVGLGLSIVLVDFGPSNNIKLLVGIIIGVVGLALCGINQLIYPELLNTRKDKYSVEITKLAKEITAK